MTLIAVSYVLAIIALVFAVIVAVVAIYFKHRRRQMELWHETARLALEKGQPLPPLSLGATGGHPRNDVRIGLIMIAVAGGIWLLLPPTGARPVTYLAAIPGFIGVALLLNGFFEVLFSKKQPAPDARPPQT